MLGSLYRSTPFRLAVVFGLLFICTFLISGAVAFRLISQELNVRYSERIQETYRIIVQTYADSDVQDLIDATRVHIAETRHQQSVFLLTAPDGQVLAANIDALRFPEGWSEWPAVRLGVNATRSTYRAFTGSVAGYRLTVAESDQETRQLQRIVFASFVWSSAVVVILAVAGGIWLASRAQRRLNAVRDTMQQVAHGELAARIPLMGSGDDLDQLARDINEALDRLSASVEGMRQVSTDIAHDLKTPLGHLKIALEDARIKFARTQDITEELDQASEEADQINQTFEALLRIAQIESGARKSRFARVDLDELFAALEEVYADVADDEGHAIEGRDFAPGAHIIWGDRQLLIQLYANLIENAIRHTPAGTVIRLGAAIRQGRVCTIVEDTGPGIPASEHDKVFRRLYRLEKSRTSPGTGLGLSLVKAVAELHGCDVRIENAEPGLRVVICYPTLQQPKQEE